MSEHLFPSLSGRAEVTTLSPLEGKREEARHRSLALRLAGNVRRLR
jgi:hypothetical protein